ncbi:MAG: flavodoxin domain-containing protein [Desulfatibacillaceae bacterium]
MARALVVYASRSGNTTRIAELVAEGLRFGGADVEVKEARDIGKPEELEGYDAYVFGSSTYHGDMLPSMKTFLFLCEKAPLQDAIGGAFGAFGWSGEATDRIFETMKHIFNMDMTGDYLRLKNADLGGGIRMAQDYGREIAGKITTG